MPKTKQPGSRKDIGKPEDGLVVRPTEPNVIGFSSQVASPPRGEAGVAAVCASVVEHLNLAGGDYAPPIANPGGKTEDGIDCVAHGTSSTLSFQVTRAMRHQAFWEALGTTKGATMQKDVDAYVLDLWDAISAKAAVIPQRQRPSMTLVLDATELLAHISERVAVAFEAAHGAAARALGFAAIWIAIGIPGVVRAQLPGSPGVRRLA